MTQTEADLLRKVTRSYSQAQRFQAGCCGTTFTQCQILCAIGAEGSIPQAALGAKLGLEKSWVSRAVDRLAVEGLVERRKCCEDARMYDVAFTDEGRKRFEALNSALNAQVEAVMTRIPKAERTCVRKALELLADAISVLSGECRCDEKSSTASAPIFIVRPSRPNDKPAVGELLRSRGLPAAGFEKHFGTFIVAEKGKTLQACAGFERYGSYALVRSVAVAEETTGRGIGTAIARELECRMMDAGISQAFLLTESAQGFWERLGFNVIEREAAPRDIGVSEEFQSACPKAAILMTKKLETSR